VRYTIEVRGELSVNSFRVAEKPDWRWAASRSPVGVVGQYRPRFVYQRPGQGNPLLFAAGKLARPVIAPVFKAYFFEPVTRNHQGPRAGPMPPAIRAWQRFLRGELWKQIVKTATRSRSHDAAGGRLPGSEVRYVG